MRRYLAAIIAIILAVKNDVIAKEVEQLCSKAEALMMNPNISQADKTLLQSALTSLTDLITNVMKNPPDIERIISELEQKYPNL